MIECNHYISKGSTDQLSLCLLVTSFCLTNVHKKNQIKKSNAAWQHFLACGHCTRAPSPLLLSLILGLNLTCTVPNLMQPATFWISEWNNYTISTQHLAALYAQGVFFVFVFLNQPHTVPLKGLSAIFNIWKQVECLLRF